MFFLFFIGLTFAFNCTMKTEKDELLPCIIKADTDNDNEINATEITNFINLHHLEKILNLNLVLKSFDYDKNNKLTMTDFNNTQNINPFILCIYCESMNLNK